MLNTVGDEMGVAPAPYVRARDLRANIATLGFEKGVVVTLELMLEENSSQRQTMREVVAMLDGMVDQLNKMIGISVKMRDEIESIKRIDGDSE
jgi:hypothetical protein